MSEDRIMRLAAKICSSVEVEYTEKNSPKHVFKKGSDTVKVFDNPKMVMRFTAVLSGKEWDDGPVKTIISFTENGRTKFGTGREWQESYGQPVAWNSLPAPLKKIVTEAVSGKY